MDIIQIPFDFNTPLIKECECGCGQPAPIATMSKALRGHKRGQPMRYVLGHSLHKYIPTEERFWSKVDKSGGPDACWPWLGSRDKDGYGQFSVAGRQVKAARYAWATVHGPMPKDKITRHSCDNPPCVNPAHLLEGTCMDNRLDMLARGRGDQPKGEQHPNSRLTEEAVREIRQTPSTPGIDTAFAVRFGVSRGAVSMARHRKTWKHVA